VVFGAAEGAFMAGGTATAPGRRAGQADYSLRGLRHPRNLTAMSRGADSRGPRVLLVPGGASTVHGYFPQLRTSLGTRASVIEVDPPGIGRGNDRRPLRLPVYAGELAQAVRSRGDGPLVVAGHSLGGLVALRLAVDEPDLVAGLLLLDPTPPAPRAALSAMAVFLKVLAGLGPVGRRLWDARARRDLRGISINGEQERALGVYTHPRFVAETSRWARHLAGDGTALAGDLAGGKARAVPAVVVSAGEHAPKSAVRRAHQQIAAWIPGADLQVWEGTRHPLHIQQPDRVADAVLGLLERAGNPRPMGG
jgi:pimeloyl-ACP methyl ester carboxylesterase